MKKSIVLLLLLAACSKSNYALLGGDSSAKITAESQTSTIELKKHALSPYVGYWVHQNGDYANVIEIFDDYDSTSEQIVTKARGLDLYPAFKVVTLATGDADVPKIDVNPDGDVVEALLARTINGDEIVFEITFQVDGDVLKVNMTDGEKTVSDVYKRADMVADATRLMQKIQLERTRQALRKALNAKDFSKCADYYIEHDSIFNLTCIKDLGKKLSQAQKLKLLARAAEEGSAETLEYALSLGVSPNAKLDEYGNTALSLATKAGRRSINIGEHGFVSLHLERAEIIRLLLHDRAQFNNPAPSAADLIYQSMDWKTAALVIKNLRDTLYTTKAKEIPKVMTALFEAGYKKRWGHDARALLEQLLREDFKYEYDHEVALSSAAKHGDKLALRLLHLDGAPVRDLTGELVEKIAEEKARLADPTYSAYKDQAEIAENIRRMEENLEYLKSL